MPFFLHVYARAQITYHCKNGSVTLTQVWLSELQLHYETMCKQIHQKNAPL